MAYKFELHIQCTKDISKLSIDFTDGTSMVQHSEHSEHSEYSQDSRDSQVLQFNESGESNTCNESIQSEIVQKPTIERISDKPKVAEELQNMEI